MTDYTKVDVPNTEKIHGNCLIVVNKRNPQRKGYIYIPIYRPFPLGKPFILNDPAEREDVIAKFETVYDELRQNNIEFKSTIDYIIAELLKGNHIALSCYCKPKSCHGDIIKNKILEEIETVHLKEFNSI